jgi:hypothetical protein
MKNDTKIYEKAYERTAPLKQWITWLVSIKSWDMIKICKSLGATQINFEMITLNNNEGKTLIYIRHNLNENM